MAQRLARRINPKCKVKHNVKEKYPELHAQALENMAHFMTDNKAAFAKECKRRNITQEMLKEFQQWILYGWSWKDSETGEDINPYKWRVWLYEIMEFTDEVKESMLEWASSLRIEKQSLDNGMINLERDWVLKIIQGITTLDELYRLTKHKETYGEKR